MTASPTPTAAVPGDVGLPSEETVARLFAPDAFKAFDDDYRPGQQAPSSAQMGAIGRMNEARARARAILSLIRPAFDAKDQRIRELAALLDKQMGTPCEQIRHQQEIEAKEQERKNLVAMAGGGLRSLAEVMKATFAGRGVDISDDEAERAARGATELIIYAAMAGNPREWCLSCGTVSGDGQCHCTEPFAAASCNRQARNYMSEMACEASASEARAISAEAKLAQAVEDEREACAKVAEKIGACVNSDGRGEGDERFAEDIADSIRARSASARGETSALASVKETP